MIQLRIIQKKLVKLIVAAIGWHILFAVATGFCLIERDVRQFFPAKMLAQRKPRRVDQH